MCAWSVRSTESIDSAPSQPHSLEHAMNHTLHTCVLVVLLVLAGASDGLGQRTAYPVWQVTDTDAGPSWCTGMVKLPGGDVVCVGDFEGATGLDMLAARLDEDGNF